jgi:hypothetical protein
MDPKKARMYLQVAAVVLGAAAAITAKLLDVDITNTAAVIGVITGVIGGMFGKASEAPGGVPKWKIPDHLLKFIPK